MQVGQSKIEKSSVNLQWEVFHVARGDGEAAGNGEYFLKYCQIKFDGND